ncbi:MAG TPA: hypothetical protein VJ806_07920 [Luteimonas sp.]|nr:hypothetical protein [Luteimonas sp.]
MNPNDVIEAYVVDVVRRLPRKDREEIGFELRGLLSEMLADRAQAEGKAADDAMVLAMLREFGTPAEVAARYRPPGTTIIPADQTRTFAWMALGGVALQWALTLPRVFEGQHLSTWWLTWGLGSFWWPGFMVTMALLAAGLRQTGLFKPAWKPRVVDPDRIERLPSIFGLVCIAVAVVFMVCLPWIAKAMPGPLPQIFAFDPTFLRVRAPFALLLWAGFFAVRIVVLAKGRWSAATRRWETVGSLAFAVVLVWWIAAGDIFQAKPTDDGAKAALALVVVMIVAALIYELFRRRPQLRAPKIAG